MLFPTMANENCSCSYQIKSFEDPTYGVTLKINENEDPEAAALEYLGYFVVPEISDL